MKSGIVNTRTGLRRAVKRSSRPGAFLAALIGLAVFSVTTCGACVGNRLRCAAVQRDLREQHRPDL